ncbi:MAG: hypothetical protein CMP48_27910 [Rickettsiales bacterium]|nr:hypothetical protein [Rickettsiales bacterium]MBR11490.1 hypothetical protein [Rickettsiales bacterium]|tara:strand:+ start:944 stop:1330 length:387 start_codon:yes stop_codon:yes gene_type:complete
MELIEHLKSKGYRQVLSEKSNSFGDFVEQFSSSVLTIRFSSSKSFEMLDVCSVKETNNWYDVALIKSLIDDQESKLNEKADMSILVSFLSENLEQVEALFDTESYNRTKEKLGELEQKRVSQMFPNIS